MIRGYEDPNAAGQDWVGDNGKGRASMPGELPHDIHRNHGWGTGMKRSCSFGEGNNEVAMAEVTPLVSVQALKEPLEETDVHPLPLLCQQSGCSSLLIHS